MSRLTYVFAVWLLLVLPLSVLTAQVAIPVDRDSPTRRGRSVFSSVALYPEVGLNTAIARRFRRSVEFPGRFVLQPGWRAGLSVLFNPQSSFSLLFGAEFLTDRAERDGFNEQVITRTGVNDLSFTNSIADSRLTFREQFLRVRFGFEHQGGRFRISYGLAYVAPFDRRGADFTYERTIGGFLDQVTGDAIPLRPAVVTQASSQFGFQPEYLAFMVGLGYQLAPRVRLTLDYDTSLFFGDISESTFTYQRVGLTVGYNVLGARAGAMK